MLTVARTPESNKAKRRNQEAEEKTRTAGFDPICEILVGDAEKMIASYAQGHDISLIVMGAYGYPACVRLFLVAPPRKCSEVPKFLYCCFVRFIQFCYENYQYYSFP